MNQACQIGVVVPSDCLTVDGCALWISLESKL